MKRRPFLLSFVVVCLLVVTVWAIRPVTPSHAGTTTRRVNVPYGPAGSVAANRAVFWFGKLAPDTNFVDVRTLYNNQELVITLHIYDRQLWYDLNPNPATFTEWDTAALYLQVGGNLYRFMGQFAMMSKPRPPYQAVYTGNGGSWTQATLPFETSVGSQASGLNDDSEDRGWNITFRVPYSSLGLSGPPAPGTLWRLGLAVHDRDTANPGSIPVQVWPEGMTSSQPSTWGELHFGLPTYHPELARPEGMITIAHGVNGATVMDAHVGGGFLCGSESFPNIWTQWGNMNRAGDKGFNVQNQWNLADWPCFSRAYLTFPVVEIPAGKTLISARLILHHFGNSGLKPGDAPPTFIQVHTVAEDWNEGAITWNNGPMAVQNHRGTWVQPKPQGMPPGSTLPYAWDMSVPYLEALAAGQPLRIALYGADSSMHTGKYFRSSDFSDPALRPTLVIQWGEPADLPDQVFLPLQTR